ncbi:uncharacterized protein [Panulirus ornatus]|uniref:uncharacterized protein n=1 Tax=Panulirus ornatus TaxID=150431 RepID=UPI003A8B19B3
MQEDEVKNGRRSGVVCSLRWLYQHVTCGLRSLVFDLDTAQLSTTKNDTYITQRLDLWSCLVDMAGSHNATGATEKSSLWKEYKRQLSILPAIIRSTMGSTLESAQDK